MARRQFAPFLGSVGHGGKEKGIMGQNGKGGRDCLRRRRRRRRGKEYIYLLYPLTYERRTKVKWMFGTAKEGAGKRTGHIHAHTIPVVSGPSSDVNRRYHFFLPHTSLSIVPTPPSHPPSSLRILFSSSHRIEILHLDHLSSFPSPQITAVLAHLAC